jgi:hypothetical protein
MTFHTRFRICMAALFLADKALRSTMAKELGRRKAKP